MTLAARRVALRRLARGLALGVAVLALVLGVALALVASDLPPAPPPRDVFGFVGLAGGGRPALPPVLRHRAADGSELAYRIYPSSAERLVVFVHGSSYHGGAYDALARALSEAGVATVVTPNLRGHFLSGIRRGDVDYIDQLEDDLRDLIGALRREGRRGPVTLGGHSSGGGLAIRFAGGAHSELASSFLLLAPVIPTSPALRGGDAGGWSVLHGRRLAGLLVLNAFGIHGFDGLPVIAFNKPERYWDGSETLSYSHRLNTSYHPRFDHASDIAAIGERPLLLLVGERDQAVDPGALLPLFGDLPRATTVVLPGVDHFGVFSDPAALARIEAWLRALR